VPDFGAHRRKLEALAEVAERPAEAFASSHGRGAAATTADAEASGSAFDFDAALAVPE